MLKQVKLLFWNDQRELPRWLFLLRMLLVLVGIVGSVIYITPNKDIPKIMGRAYRKINEGTSGIIDINDPEKFQITMLSLLIGIIFLVVLS